MRFRVAKDLLPHDEDERFEVLDDYFCELKAWAVETGDEWEIVVERPDRDDYYIDSRLADGLDWYSGRYGKVSAADIPAAVHRSATYQLSLNDSWTLWSWSHWLSGRSPAELDVTILHVDDHDDLMTPRLLVRGDWIDALTGDGVHVRDANSIQQAILSGAIGIGSFMAPFVRTAQRVDVRHLCGTSYAVERPGVYRMEPAEMPDTLLHLGDVHPGVRWERVDAAVDPDRRYSVTSDLRVWANDLRPGPVLLHIDMDYFNNRYNGCSDWQQRRSYDPPLEEVLAEIERLFKVLRDTGASARIEDVAIALSPGFFPAELWQPSIQAIERQLSMR